MNRRNSRRVVVWLAAGAIAAGACSDRTVTTSDPTPVRPELGGDAPPAVNMGAALLDAAPTPEAGPADGEQPLILLNTGGSPVITFDGQPDNAPIGSTYASLGITFTSGQFLNQGGNLNHSNYPPRSGTGVAYNLTGSTVAFQLDRASSRVGAYVTSLYGITLSCYRADGSLVGSASAPSPNLANYSGSVAPPNHHLEVAGSGITACSFGSTPNYFTIDDLSFSPDSPIEIVEVTTQLPDSSFTTRNGENLISLRAEVGDPAMASRVKWKVVDDPSDGVTSPRVRPGDGLSTSFTIGQVANPRNRWPATHPGELSDKALAYVARAYYVADGGDTIWSAPVVLRQHEKDVLRQEYIDYQKQIVLNRDSLGVFTTTNFSAGELNFGDYTVFRATDRLRAGVESFRTLVSDYLVDAGHTFNGLTATSAFRNPVHHHVHAGASSNESQHIYGNAMDVRIWGLGPTREEVFEEMRSIAKDPAVNACYEPERVVRAANKNRELTHFHIDFRASCPTGW
jgi:hypothetical protein